MGAWNTPSITTLAGIVLFPTSGSMQQGYFHLTCVTSKHTKGKWAGYVASAQNASEHNKCNREEYLQQESPVDLRKTETDVTEEVIFCGTLFK